MNKKWPETYVAGPLIQHITHNVKLARQAIDHQNLKQHQDWFLSNPRVAETLMDIFVKNGECMISSYSIASTPIKGKEAFY